MPVLVPFVASLLLPPVLGALPAQLVHVAIHMGILKSFQGSLPDREQVSQQTQDPRILQTIPNLKSKLDPQVKDVQGEHIIPSIVEPESHNIGRVMLP